MCWTYLDDHIRAARISRSSPCPFSDLMPICRSHCLSASSYLLGTATGGSVFALLRRTGGCEAEPKARGPRLMPIAIAMSILPGVSPAGCSG